MRQLQQAVVEGRRAEEHARVGAGDGIGLDARVLERMPCDLHCNALLGVHAGCFAIRDREERVVELDQVVEKSAMAHRAVVTPARGDATAAFREQRPVGGETVRTRKAARHADDHHGIRVAGRRVSRFRSPAVALDPAAQVTSKLPDAGMVIEVGGRNLDLEPARELGRQAGRIDRAQPVLRERAIGAHALLRYLRDFRSPTRQECFHLGCARRARSHRRLDRRLGVGIDFPLRDDPQAALEKRPLRLAALDLAARRLGRGAGLYQHHREHRQVERGAHCAADGAEHLVVRSAPVGTREFLNDNDPLLAIERDRENGATAWCKARVSAPDLTLGVLRVVVVPMHDDEILDSASCEEVAFVDESQVPGSKELLAASIARHGRAHRLGGFVGPVPIAAGNAPAVDPDLPDLVRGAFGQASGIDDLHRGAV
ncbi:hypothetical protein AWB67_06881 [Caballeronia terrestris]|uniref:Uncharacterized protein n=1 Tax=Caballeronia terrestris TaxID=1226301 RepID=A0A158KXS6_9BURK|nr:hypothetical protein AWB67_06881 [Caballeronia terrestris]